MAELVKGRKLLERFVLVESLGRSGQGEIWRALDESRSAQIALKILPAVQFPALLIQHAFASEVAGRGVIEHFEPARDESVAVLPLELAAADARSLRAKSWTQSLALLREVAETLATMHDKGIVHGDIKPSNILIGFDGRARVADFGITVRQGERRVARVVSPFSASPQQHAGEPASFADDVFGFGALAYELLCGYPPNFPDLERATSGLAPPRLITAVTTPPPLVDLVMSMLAGNAADRPRDLRSVAKTLEAFEAQRFTPIVAATVAPVVIDASRPHDERAIKPSIGSWIVIAALAAALVAVFVFLPRFASTPKVLPAVLPQETGETSSSRVDGDEQSAVQQRIRDFEEADARYRAQLEELESQGAGIWGGTTFAAAKSLGAQASDAEASRDYVLALDRISVANQRLDRVVAERPRALERQLRDGDTALDAGRLELAKQAFELAKRIDPTNSEAGRGLARVSALGPVLTALVAAETASLTLDHLSALTRYEEVLRADPVNRVAREGVARARSAIGTDRYARQIGESLAALRAGNTQAAREALASASALRPGGAEVVAVRSQIDAAGTRQDLESTRAEISALEVAEQWGEALLRYDALLARDPTLGFARTGRARVAPRAELARRIDLILNNPSRLSAPEVRREADRLLADATRISGAAPVLRRQSESLREAVKLYDKPVLAVLESDGVTLVAVQRIGNFGAFTRREIQLKPGRYVAVGSREGFRDVRREFTVTPESSMMVISVRCTEAVS